MFPPGINRLLTRDGQTTPANKAALEESCLPLRNACYRDFKCGYFEPRRIRIKVASPLDVAERYGAQLRTIFKYIVPSPLLLNINGSPYFLWGGVADNQGASTRLKGMQDIFLILRYIAERESFTVRPTDFDAM